jgi:hypothetical protein
MGDHAKPGAGVAPDIASVRIAMQSYLSTHHLWAAEHFTRLAVECEAAHTGESRFSIKDRAYVIGAVGESVAFLEAFINELYQHAADGEGDADGLSPDMVRRMAEYWRTTNEGRVEVTKKYDKARAFAGHPRSDADRPLHEDVKSVVDLRNWSVHYRPRWVSAEDQDTQFDHVRGRFADNAFMAGSGNTWFPDHALGAGCAGWAVQSVRAFVDEFVAVIGCKANYQIAGLFREQP